tara:strand:- start:154 stop:444 length:291 start_codon:yes stop_codon:yes gene_type:complete
MPVKKPIYEIAKSLGIDSKKLVKACNSIGIYAKGASKRLDLGEEERIITYFKNGQNVSNEVIDIKIKPIKNNQIPEEEKSLNKLSNNLYFPNRLIK